MVSRIIQHCVTAWSRNVERSISKTWVKTEEFRPQKMTFTKSLTKQHQRRTMRCQVQYQYWPTWTVMFHPKTYENTQTKAIQSNVSTTFVHKNWACCSFKMIYYFWGSASVTLMRTALRQVNYFTPKLAILFPLVTWVLKSFNQWALL